VSDQGLSCVQAETIGDLGEPCYSPFGRDERDREITEEDARLLEGEPFPLILLIADITVGQ
jgi:hypothetical protein